MARTTRNKNLTHMNKNWSVRDDGLPYRLGGDIFGNSLYERGEPNDMPRYRRKWSRCERASFRRMHYQSYRAKTKNLLRTGRWDDIIDPKRTSGWLTW